MNAEFVKTFSSNNSTTLLDLFFYISFMTDKMKNQSYYKNKKLFLEISKYVDKSNILGLLAICILFDSRCDGKYYPSAGMVCVEFNDPHGAKFHSSILHEKDVEEFLILDNLAYNIFKNTEECKAEKNWYKTKIIKKTHASVSYSYDDYNYEKQISNTYSDYDYSWIINGEEIFSGSLSFDSWNDFEKIVPESLINLNEGL